jgi:hypothetical protein
MSGPDDPLQKVSLAIEGCNELLKTTESDLASPRAERRQQAALDMRHLGELGRMIIDGQTRPIDARADVCISSLAAHLDELHAIAADRSDQKRQQAATQLLAALDRLAVAINKAGRPPNRVA